MSVRTAPTAAAPSAPRVVPIAQSIATSIVEAASGVAATCWWHGRVHHNGH